MTRITNNVRSYETMISFAYFFSLSSLTACSSIRIISFFKPFQRSSRERTQTQWTDCLGQKCENERRPHTACSLYTSAFDTHCAAFRNVCTKSSLSRTGSQRDQPSSGHIFGQLDTCTLALSHEEQKYKFATLVREQWRCVLPAKTRSCGAQSLSIRPTEALVRLKVVCYATDK